MKDMFGKKIREGDTVLLVGTTLDRCTEHRWRVIEFDEGSVIVRNFRMGNALDRLPDNLIVIDSSAIVL